ncbi:GPP34 family phosphoprotein [Actinoplanes sp. TRM 88003]|uniref:GPP34 family phosphoprotein n=1 Tax=Paractinoplanes aksuensis TaxID=2939490 RepID=A0ABT1E287_9ACTN|nr:GPP34 family phosphoprotein [Actinoplanes aksuensis]MCO8276250.1 GPP34 family phosphoprotein [Actinoplanes aksuensis]
MPDPPILAEDLLLLLFQPDSGPQTTDVRADQSTLSDALAGAVLADLGLSGHLRLVPGQAGAKRVEAVAQQPPADDILRLAWEFLAAGPRGIDTALAAIGPDLHGELLDRLVRRGDIRRSRRTTLGVLEVEVLEDAGTGRREDLLAAVREVLVDGVDPPPRLAALAALVAGSGTLAQFGPGIPRDASLIARAKKFDYESGGATAAAEAIARTIAAAVVSK